jgi:hypothetical protein
LTVATGRDGGVHLYYQLPPGADVRNNNSGKLGDHIDARGSGGYCVCPPSTHVSGRQYRFVDTAVAIAVLPDWVVDRLRRPAPPPSSASNGAATKVGAGGRTNLLVSLAGTMLKRGMSLDAITAALLAENTARCDPPLAEQKVREIAADIVRRYPAGTANGAADPMQAAMLDPRPKVRLPGDNCLLSQTASELGKHFAAKLLYIRNGDIVTLDGHELHVVTAQTFRTLVEYHVICYRKKANSTASFDIDATMHEDEARGIMSSSQFREKLRCVCSA